MGKSEFWKDFWLLVRISLAGGMIAKPTDAKAMNGDLFSLLPSAIVAAIPIYKLLDANF